MSLFGCLIVILLDKNSMDKLLNIFLGMATK